MIEKIIKPFGIELESDITDWAPVPFFTIESGATAMEAIYHGLQLQQARPQSGRGGQLIVREQPRARGIGTAKVGAPILTYSVGYDAAQRFSAFIAKGQQPLWDGGALGSVIGEVAGLVPVRYRPKLIHTFTDIGNETAQSAAKKAATSALGKQSTLTLSVNGWRAGDGTFFEIGDQLTVELPDEGINETMSLTGLTFAKSVSAGTTASLTLKLPESQRPTTGRAPSKVTAKTGTFSNLAPTQEPGAVADVSTDSPAATGIFTELGALR